MKRLLLVLTALVLSVSGGVASAAEAQSAAGTPGQERAIDSNRLPGVALAEGISQVTGVAISPLLGVSAVGAWRYYRTPAALRDRLPWFCHPIAWGFGLGLLVLCFLKDLFGAATPALLKKPLDLLELFENKVSGLVASAAIIPLIAAQMAEAFADAPGASTSLSGDVHYGSMLAGNLAFIDPRLFFVPFAFFAFAVVWVTSNAINVLILLSPFGFVDAILKLMKTGVLSGLAVASLINPFLGAAVSLVIICLAAWLAPQAFRFTVFGLLLAADVVMPSRGRRLATPNEAHVFTTRRMGSVAASTFGRLTRTGEGEVRFTYRPWMILGKRTVALPLQPVTVERGILYPSLLQPCGPSGRLAAVFAFLPRYSGREESLAELLGATEVREHTLARGFQAIRSWVVAFFDSCRGRLADPGQAPAA